MRASGWRRLAAWGIDCVAALGWAAVLAAVVWPERDGTALRRLAEHPVLENLVGFAALVLPVTVVLAWTEHRWGRTPGKRLVGLQVVTRPDGGPPSMGRALVRNGVKIALPWGIGHAAVYLLADGPATPGAPAIVLTCLSYVLPVVALGGIFSRRLRAPHDALADTGVVTAR